MDNKRLGVGFIGAGFITQFHIRSWINVRNADILGIVSLSLEESEQAAALARSLNVGNAKPFNSITEMVADPAIDAIWICAPNYTRIENMEEIVKALEDGKGELIGVACEKPLGRNVAEAKKMLALVNKAGLLDGYLEDQIFSHSVERGKKIVWERGAKFAGRPYLARAAEEHSGPHMPWFWEGSLQGGGVINDMMCHSVEVAQYLLTPPGADRNVLTPVKVSAYANCLKWQEPEYAQSLSTLSNGKLDYINRPAEDFGRGLIEYRDEEGKQVVVEATTSWCYMGAGLRLSLELLGPEYSMEINSLNTGLNVFFSRNVAGKKGEDLVEKQNAEMGLMPIVSDEAGEYGYTGENRHMVQAFLSGKRPDENFEDGLRVTKLLMAAYMSVEQEATIDFQKAELENFVPAVAKGMWNPKNK